MSKHWLNQLAIKYRGLIESGIFVAALGGIATFSVVGYTVQAHSQQLKDLADVQEQMKDKIVDTNLMIVERLTAIETELKLMNQQRRK